MNNPDAKDSKNQQIEPLSVYLQLVEQSPCFVNKHTERGVRSLSILFEPIFAKIWQHTFVFISLLVAVLNKSTLNARELFTKSSFLDAFCKMGMMSYDNEMEIYLESEPMFWNNFFKIVSRNIFFHDMSVSNLTRVYSKFVEFLEYSFYVRGIDCIDNVNLIMENVPTCILESILSKKTMRPLILRSKLIHTLFNTPEWYTSKNVITLMILPRYNFQLYNTDTHNCNNVYRNNDCKLILQGDDAVLNHFSKSLEHYIEKITHSNLQEHMNIELTKLVVDYMGFFEIAEEIYFNTSLGRISLLGDIVFPSRIV